MSLISNVSKKSSSFEKDNSKETKKKITPLCMICADNTDGKLKTKMDFQ